MHAPRLGMLFIVVAAVGACDHTAHNPTAPSSTPVPTVAAPAPSPSSTANWRADATVVTVESHGSLPCGWGTAAGDSRSGVAWRVKIDGTAISLDEDMANWPTDDVPFAGTLAAQRFTGTYQQGADYLRYVCQFREATLEGTFNADFTTFEATERLAWGPPGGDSVVTRHWFGSRITQ